MLFFLKVKIDVAKMSEFGQKLFSGELERSQTIYSCCLKDNPEVGLNIWETENREEFEMILDTYKPYFSEIIEIKEVIKPMDSFVLLQKRNGDAH